MKRILLTAALFLVYLCLTADRTYAWPLPPVAVTPYEIWVKLGENACLDGSGSYDPDGYIYSWSWTFGDGQEAGNYGYPPSCVYHQYPLGGYWSTLTVLDNSNLSDYESVKVYSADCSISCSQPVVPVNGMAEVSLSVSPSDSTVMRAILRCDVGYDHIQVFTKSGGQYIPLSLPAVWGFDPPLSALPGTIYVKGITPSQSVNDVQLMLQVGPKYWWPRFVPTSSLGLTVIQVDIDVDSDRNGTIDGTPEEEALEETQPAIVPVNIDDDDNWEKDCTNNCIDSESDLSDLVKVIIRQVPSGWTATLTVETGDPNKFRLFNGSDYWQQGDPNWVPGDPNPAYSYPVLGKRTNYPTVSSYQIPNLGSDLEYYMEALDFRSPTSENWTIKLTVTNGTLTFHDTVALRPSPFILLPGSASAVDVYAPDVYGPIAAVCNVQVSYNQYNDPWLQDEVEIGYTKWPGGQMWVAWDLPRDRGLDDWPESLLGPDYGHFSYGSGTESGNYGGNIEATEPVTYDGQYRPCGIVVVGGGCSLTGFIEAQGVQPVLPSSHTAFLAVGHIDEVVSFTGASSVLIADTDVGRSLIEQFVNQNTTASGTATGGSADYVEDSGKNWGVDQWSEGYVEIIDSSTGEVQVRQIIRNDGTKIYVYDSQTGKGRQCGSSFPGSHTWTYTIVARSEYRAMFFEGEEAFGIVTQVNGATMVDNTNTKDWSTTNLAGGYVMVFRGWQGDDDLLSIQKKRIAGNGTNSITIEGYWDYDPDECRYVLVERSKMEGAYWDTYYGPSTTTPACTTVRALWAEYGGWQQACQTEIDLVKADLSGTKGPFNASSFTKVPALFTSSSGAVALVPGMVNLLNKGTLHVPKPYGPRNAAGDVFEQAMSGGSFVDCWPLHDGDGEIHCGTNAKRAIPQVDWWR